MRKFIIYGSGLIVVAFIVGILLFLTIDNAMSGQAVYGNRSGDSLVSGPASILINVGIICMVGSLLSFIAYLFSRSPVLLKSYKIIGAISGALIFIGLALGQA